MAFRSSSATVRFRPGERNWKGLIAAAAIQKEAGLAQASGTDPSRMPPAIRSADFPRRVQSKVVCLAAGRADRASVGSAGYRQLDLWRMETRRQRRR